MKMLEKEIVKIAARITRMHHGFIEEEKTPTVKKIEEVFRNIKEMFHELKQDMNISENKTEGISNQKDILRRLILRTKGIHNQATLLLDLNEALVKEGKSNPKSLKKGELNHAK